MSTRTFTPSEKEILSALDAIVRRRAVKAEIDAAILRLERRLASDSAAPMAWETLPRALDDPGLPAGIRSGWVFILRAGAITGAERHPNSHQRTLSYRGRGDLQILEGPLWRRGVLTSAPSASLVKRWASIPPNTWHQVVVGKKADWVVVSFHTVPVEELVEERPRSDGRRAYERRRYVGETAR